MFSQDEREQIRAALVTAAQQDPMITAAAHLGSPSRIEIKSCQAEGITRASLARPAVRSFTARRMAGASYPLYPSTGPPRRRGLTENVDSATASTSRRRDMRRLGCLGSPLHSARLAHGLPLGRDEPPRLAQVALLRIRERLENPPGDRFE